MSKDYPRLEVYLGRSVLHDGSGQVREFVEGRPNAAARTRLATIKAKLELGFITDLIIDCSRPDVSLSELKLEAASALRDLVDSVTSEVGRALVGLTFLQLAVKAIEPQQCIRLHKGGGKGGHFSWVDGLPMRVIDKEYITPALRNANLLKVNSDGVFMTRSLAENYPYSPVYKAAIRGARKPWIDIVEFVEAGELDPINALQHLIVHLYNRSEAFIFMTKEALGAVRDPALKIDGIAGAIEFLLGFINSSAHSARLFEVAMHSLMQVIEDSGSLEGALKPLSQMRSANLKHGNIGDIEILAGSGRTIILEAWDAKYGKSYLYEELDELSVKLKNHPEVVRVGFVVEVPPDLREDVIRRRGEVQDLFDVTIDILSFRDWATMMFDEYTLDPEHDSHAWVVAFTECLTQQRRDRVPIDEPCDAWVRQLTAFTLLHRG